VRRLSRAVCSAALLMLALASGLTLLTAPAGAQNPIDHGRVDVVEVSGLLDPVLADFVASSIEQAAQDESRAIILQINSGGAVVDDSRIASLAEVIADSPIPVGAWVGPSGANAEGRVGQLVGTTDFVGISPGSHIGDFSELVVPPELLKPSYAEAYDGLIDDRADDERAIELGLAVDAPTLGDFLIDLPFVDTEIDDSGEQPRRTVLTEVRFGQLPLVNQLFHTMASPAVAYLLFVIGMALLLFEFYTAGVGIAGVIGAACFIGGCYGLDVLPARGWAVALLVIAMIGFGIDVQVGVPRFWSGVGVLALTVGTVMLFDGVGLSWITQIAGIVGISLAMLAGMPAMVRTRFSTPTIGREWMIGELGEAAEAVDPEGTVVIRDAKWRARTNRATPIEQGDAVRVASIEGVVLQVEPIDGAARDYRDHG
jgi:membrane-bound serine protease (ClpP class)